MKIDSYTHFACPAFMDHLEAESGHPMVFRGLFSAIPELMDIDLRIRQVNKCTGHSVITHVYSYHNKILLYLSYKIGGLLGSVRTAVICLCHHGIFVAVLCALIKGVN